LRGVCATQPKDDLIIAERGKRHKEGWDRAGGKYFTGQCRPAGQPRNADDLIFFGRKIKSFTRILNF
jgi:hypothetical protein